MKGSFQNFLMRLFWLFWAIPLHTKKTPLYFKGLQTPTRPGCATQPPSALGPLHMPQPLDFSSSQLFSLSVLRHLISQQAIKQNNKFNQINLSLLLTGPSKNTWSLSSGTMSLKNRILTGSWDQERSEAPSPQQLGLSCARYCDFPVPFFFLSFFGHLRSGLLNDKGPAQWKGPP